MGHFKASSFCHESPNVLMYILFQIHMRLLSKLGHHFFIFDHSGCSDAPIIKMNVRHN